MATDLTEPTDPIEGLVIRSSVGTGALVLHPLGDEAGRPYRAHLRCGTVEASALVQVGRDRLAAFVDGMAADWKGWEGERVWAVHPAGTDYSTPALQLRAANDRRGHVVLRVELAWPSLPDPDAPEWGPTRPGEWRAEGFLALDAGQLETLAAEVRDLPFDSDGWW